jgi:hypothetical protein
VIFIIAAVAAGRYKTPAVKLMYERDRSCVFGDISGGEMVLSDRGRIAQVSWIGLSSRFPAVLLDSFVVMPNHIHGIIIVGAQFIVPASVPHNRTDTAQEGAMNRAPTLGEIVRAYKAGSTRLIRQTTNADFAWPRKLLRTHCPKRRISKSYPPIYSRKPFALGDRPGESGHFYSGARKRMEREKGTFYFARERFGAQKSQTKDLIPKRRFDEAI